MQAIYLMLYTVVTGSDNENHENQLQALRTWSALCHSAGHSSAICFVLYRVITGSDNEKHQNRLTRTEHTVRVVSFCQTHSTLAPHAVQISKRL